MNKKNNMGILIDWICTALNKTTHTQNLNNKIFLTTATWSSKIKTKNKTKFSLTHTPLIVILSKEKKKRKSSVLLFFCSSFLLKKDHLPR
jgi:ABC-type uncharacterized transport system permease subunit